MTVSKDEKGENFLVETFNLVRHFNDLCSLRTGYQNSSSHAHMKPQCFQDGGRCKSELGNSATICLGKGFITRKSFFFFISVSCFGLKFIAAYLQFLPATILQYLPASSSQGHFASMNRAISEYLAT